MRPLSIPFLGVSSLSVVFCIASSGLKIPVFGVDADAQIVGSECHVTMIRSNGMWIAGSEMLECDPNLRAVMGDGTQDYRDSQDNSCGLGNGCRLPAPDREVRADLGCLLEQHTESEVDELAQVISSEIKSKPNRKRKEYGAIIFYHPTRGYRRSTLVPGTSEGIRYPIGERRSGETAVALVHNHPTDGGTAASEDDWQGAEALLESPLASEDNFSIYVLDVDNNQLAEFDADDRRDREVNSSESRHRRDAIGGC